MALCVTHAAPSELAARTPGPAYAAGSALARTPRAPGRSQPAAAHGPARAPAGCEMHSAARSAAAAAAALPPPVSVQRRSPDRPCLPFLPLPALLYSHDPQVAFSLDALAAGRPAALPGLPLRPLREFAAPCQPRPLPAARPLPSKLQPQPLPAVCHRKSDQKSTKGPTTHCV